MWVCDLHSSLKSPPFLPILDPLFYTQFHGSQVFIKFGLSLHLLTPYPHHTHLRTMSTHLGSKAIAFRCLVVVRNSKGNKVTKTIFTGSREFIMLADSGEIISQSPEPQSVSGAGLNTYRVCPTPYRMWS
jgi:hypothetical protein